MPKPHYEMTHEETIAFLTERHRLQGRVHDALEALSLGPTAEKVATYQSCSQALYLFEVAHSGVFK